MYKDHLIVVSPKIVCNRKYIIIISIIHFITFSALPFLNYTCFLVSTSQLKIQKENRASHLFIMNGDSCIKNNKAVCCSWEASVGCLKCKFTLNIYLYNVFITIYLSDVRQFFTISSLVFFYLFLLHPSSSSFLRAAIAPWFGNTLVQSVRTQWV